MDLRALLRTIVRERLAAVLALLVVVGLAGVLAAQSPERFTSEATLFVQPDSGGEGFGSVQAVSFLLPALEARVASGALETEVRGDADPRLRDAPWEAQAIAEPGTGLLVLAVTSTRADVVQPVAAAYAAALREFVTASEVPLRVSVLDPPSFPVGRTGGLSLLLSGVVLGLAAAVATALLAGRIRRPRLMSDDVRERYGIPVLGEIPAMRRRTPLSPLRLYDSNEQGAVEAFMRLRTNVEIEIAARGLYSIAVVSRGLGEGKTTVAAHLGWTLASLGHGVLLADGDLRHGGLEVLMRPAVRSAPAHGPSAPREQEATAVPRLRYLSARGMRRSVPGAGGSSRVAHPAEAVTAALPEVSARAREDRVLMIVDSPPILGAAESKYIVSVADATVVVVDGSRPLATEDLADTLRQVAEAGGTVLGVVLNRARLGRTARREEELYYVSREGLSARPSRGGRELPRSQDPSAASV